MSPTVAQAPKWQKAMTTLPVPIVTFIPRTALGWITLAQGRPCARQLLKSRSRTAMLVLTEITAASISPLASMAAACPLSIPPTTGTPAS